MDEKVIILYFLKFLNLLCSVNPSSCNGGMFSRESSLYRDAMDSLCFANSLRDK